MKGGPVVSPYWGVKCASGQRGQGALWKMLHNGCDVVTETGHRSWRQAIFRWWKVHACVVKREGAASGVRGCRSWVVPGCGRKGRDVGFLGGTESLAL